MGTLLLVAIAGTVVECTKIGNDPAFDSELLKRASEFRTTKQYETVSLQKKLPWAHILLAFSLIRNLNKLNISPYPQKLAQRKSRNTPAKVLAKRLSVFNGIKAISIVYAMLGLSFLFSWYSVISSPQEVEQKKLSYAFTIVYGSIYTCPVLFMTAGFLQAHSFL
jgi:hypothetical protein